MSLIKCEELSIGYGNEKVVEGLSFSVEKGDYLCIVGENGSGKSTLMKTLLRLSKPLSGNLVYGDGLEPRTVGYLPQQTAAQKDFPASVLEIILSGCLNSCRFIPFYTKKQREIAHEKAALMKVSDLEGRCFRELSGGQKQRVLLARALCATSNLLILDEPTAGLDPVSAAEMYRLIAELNRSGIAIIMVTHDSCKNLETATHVLHVAHRPKFFGTVKDYLESDVGIAYMKGGRKA